MKQEIANSFIYEQGNQGGPVAWVSATEAST